MKKLILFLSILFISVNTIAQENQFTNEIKAFRKQDSIQKPNDGMLLFIGSSSFRLWKDVKSDFNNQNILNRAFGGATLLDLIYFQNDVVLKYKPKKIFIYCGENDIASSEKVTPKMVFKRYKTFYKTLRKQFPETPIIFVSLKPAISRWHMKDRMMATNKLISQFMKNKKNATFVNIWDDMIENGEPRKDIYIHDNLHMNAKGYAIWVEKMNALVND
ncbi:GDSL-type esterase/lipase family protein [Flavobacterium solisilvae]|uniref:G-D-S-L family lipolytic protein n=1 Tax=Flavobacterium solisilvae TaxID=1852019 RepID=A0ABX1QYH0_9FLAO|nr:GDSL-type esterase/lipase family protein [Flavobacterium solisilvae]NMH26234.1 G-D-S-L family lipolytic protein [Flavobacterium solisilvae]